MSRTTISGLSRRLTNCQNFPKDSFALDNWISQNSFCPNAQLTRLWPLNMKGGNMMKKGNALRDFIALMVVFIFCCSSIGCSVSPSDKDIKIAIDHYLSKDPNGEDDLTGPIDVIECGACLKDGSYPVKVRLPLDIHHPIYGVQATIVTRAYYIYKTIDEKGKSVWRVR